MPRWKQEGRAALCANSVTTRPQARRRASRARARATARPTTRRPAQSVREPHLVDRAAVHLEQPRARRPGTPGLRARAPRSAGSATAGTPARAARPPRSSSPSSRRRRRPPGPGTCRPSRRAHPRAARRPSAFTCALYGATTSTSPSGIPAASSRRRPRAPPRPPAPTPDGCPRAGRHVPQPVADPVEAGPRSRDRAAADRRDCRVRDDGAPDALGGDQGGRSDGARPGDPHAPEAARTGQSLERKDAMESSTSGMQCSVADLDAREARREAQGAGGRAGRRRRAPEQTGDGRRRAAPAAASCSGEAEEAWRRVRRRRPGRRRVGHRTDTDTPPRSCPNRCMEQEHSVTVRNPEAKPTGRQVYALAHELARRFDVDFPRSAGRRRS